jgi:hypothetical protein
MSLFQIQFAATDRKRSNRVRVASLLLESPRDPSMFFINDNTQNLGGGRINSKGFISARYHYFDFIRINREDIIKMESTNKKILYSGNDGLSSQYIYSQNGTVLNTLQSNLGGNIVARDLNTEKNGAYIYKGLNQADCINYLRNLNLI